MVRARARSFSRGLTIAPRGDLVTIGDTGYGGWTVPGALLGPDSVCYLAGVGEDITFDLGVIARFGATVDAFDPVPEASVHVAQAARYEPRLRFHPVGLWSSDTTLHFSEPKVAGFVSRSATDMHGTGGGLGLPVRSIRSLMGELGHDHIDLLKISVEGSEYEILDHVLEEGVDVRGLCVEYAQPASEPEAPIRSVARLGKAGFDLVAASLPAWNWKLCFVRGRE
ncbi:MAG: FkbM family methyltransferase [Solirubrobacteraceae bacterium]